MMNNVKENSPYTEASRNLSTEALVVITMSRMLPAEWIGNGKLELAHRLYWEEKEAELQKPADAAHA